MAMNTGHPPPRLVGLVLAAGASRRFGSPKQLALIDGVPMLQRVIETAQAALPPLAWPKPADAASSCVTVVLGANADAVVTAVMERLTVPRPQVVVCADWSDGLAHSLRCGLGALEATDAQAALVLLGDTPLLQPQELRSLIALWESSPDIPAAAAFGGVLGAPCILPRSVWTALQSLTGDRGAGMWLRQYHARGAPVSFLPLPRAAMDIDRPCDLDALQRSMSMPGTSGVDGGKGAGS